MTTPTPAASPSPEDLATTRAQAEAAGAEMMREAAKGHLARRAEQVAKKLGAGDPVTALVQVYVEEIAALPLPSDALAQLISPGLSIAQEPKYTVNGHAIVNRASGEEIPADEPVFILRARDVHAIKALCDYHDAVRGGDPNHVVAIRTRVADFVQFKQEHPERMKEPDTQLNHSIEPKEAGTR